MNRPDPAITMALGNAKTPEGRERFMALVYTQLLQIARTELSRHRRSHTLNTRVLINEAYLKLFGRPANDYENRAHFYAAAARAMRQVVINYARMRLSERHGGGAEHIDFEKLEEQPLQVDIQAEQLLQIDTALEKLAALDDRLVKVVELRFFAGLAISEIAELLGVSEPTVKRDTRAAKAFMQRELAGHGNATV